MREIKGWKDITLSEFEQIQDIIEVKDKYVMPNIIDLLFNVDSKHISLVEYNKLLAQLDFLNQDIPEIKLQNDYTVNDREYRIDYSLPNVCAAQFIDYQNYLKAENVSYRDVMSVFFIPKGHIYNDGYDIQQVKDDLGCMSIEFVKSASFFFAE